MSLGWFDRVNMKRFHNSNRNEFGIPFPLQICSDALNALSFFSNSKNRFKLTSYVKYAAAVTPINSFRFSQKKSWIVIILPKNLNNIVKSMNKMNKPKKINQFLLFSSKRDWLIEEQAMHDCLLASAKCEYAAGNRCTAIDQPLACLSVYLLF